MGSGSDSERVAFGAAVAASVVLHLLIAWPLFVGEVYTYDDLTRYHLPMRQFYAQCLALGHDFAWNPDLFCGFYLHGEGQIGMLHPYHWLLYRLLPLDRAFTVETVLSYPVLQVGTFLLLRRWPLDRASAMFGALVLTFSGSLVLRLVHINAIATLAHVPWLLWATDWLLRGGRDGRAPWWAGPLVVLLTSSELLLGHPQYAYYGMLAEGWYALVLLAAGAPWRRLVALVAAKVLGVLGAAAQLVPVFHELGNSSRSEAVTGFGITKPEHLLNLVQPLAPYLFLARGFFREVPPRLGQYTHEGSLYLGAVAPVLLVWLLVRPRGSAALRVLTRGAAVLALLMLLLTFVETLPLVELYRQIPVVRLFRVSARYYVLVQLGVAVLSAVALADLIAIAGARPPKKSRVWPQFVPAGLSVIAALGFWAWVLVRSPEDTRLLAAPELAALGPALSLAAALLVAAALRGWRGAPATLILLAAVDLGGYGLTFLRAFPIMTLESFVDALPTPPFPNPGDRIQLVGRPMDRANDAMVLAGHRLVGGYAALFPRRVLAEDAPTTARVAGAGWALEHPYEPDDPVRWTPIRAPLPRARLLARAVVSDDPAGDLPAIDPAATALVARPLDLPPGAPGSARIVADRPGDVRIATDAPALRLLVLAERQHDGWRVEVDGEPQPVIACYGDFLGVVVEPGRHEVAFRFRPWSLAVGGQISLAALALLVIWAVLGAARSRRPASRVAACNPG